MTEERYYSVIRVNRTYVITENPQVLKTILGHTNLSTTMDLYSHVLPNTKAEQMEKGCKCFLNHFLYQEERNKVKK